MRTNALFLLVRAVALLLALGAFAAGVVAQTSEDVVANAGAANGRAPTRGGEIEYFVAGPADGEPVLLIHGGGLAASFVPMAREPALEGYRVIRMHRRGYAGSTEPGGPFSMRDQAADALAVLDALGIERAHVIGHSYGGAVTMQMAVDAPERVHSVVLVDTAPPPGLLAPVLADGAARLDPIAPIAAAAGARLGAGDRAGAVETFFGSVLGEDWREYFDAIPGGLEQTIADTDVLFEVENPAMGEWLAMPFDLDSIDQPTLILYGDESPLFRAEVQSAYKAAMPDAELESIANTDHALITQNPSAVAEAIAGFLARHSM